MQHTASSNLRRFIRDHEMMTFVVTVVLLCLVIYWTMVNLPALIVAILLAYLLDGIVDRLCKLRVPRLFAISTTLAISILGLLFSMLVGVPSLVEQLRRFTEQVPKTIPNIESYINEKLTSIPFSEDLDLNSQALIEPIKNWLGNAGEAILSNTFSNVLNLFNIIVYVVLIPLLLFFTLRDKEHILKWLGKFLPRSQMLTNLREAMDEQFGAYVRGKIIEAAIIFSLSLVGFLALGVNYALVLAVAIGLSVIIPFIGAIAVTVPVVVAGLLQFGFSSEFWWMMGIYAVVQALDGQLLVPLLFSEVVKIHPVAILVSILLFGAIWGVWGVFFAIPLASLIKSVIAVIEKQMQVGTT